MRRPMSPEAAYLRLSALCARSEQCAADLQRKCRTWGLTVGDTAALMERLRRERFMDDERYCAAYVHDKAHIEGWGPIKIAHGLAAKNLPHEAARRALAAIAAEVFERNLDNALRAKCLTLPAGLPRSARRQRLLAFAAGRGFAPAAAMAWIERNEGEGTEEDEEL